MTLTRRLTISYGLILALCTAVTAGMMYYELAIERRAADTAQDGEEDESPSDTVWETCLPVVLCGALGGLWLVRSALRPVRQLTLAAERLAPENLSIPLPRSGAGDELDRLSDVLNALMERVHRSMDQMRDFTLYASHELLTPLTIMRGELDGVLRRGFEDRTPVAFCISQMEEVQRLTRLVDSLTILARADAGLLHTTFAPVALHTLVRDAAESAETLAEGRITVTLETCADTTIHGDSDLLRRLLLNLADNAIKYNIPGGTVHIALTHEGKHARFTISTTGPGMDAAQCAKVFQRFYRADPSHSSTIAGTGLGLSICERITAIHHGTVTCQSTPGGPTTFTVALPRSQASAT